MSLEIFQEMDRSKELHQKEVQENRVLIIYFIYCMLYMLIESTLSYRMIVTTYLFDFANAFGQTGAVTLSDFEAYLAGDEL